MRQLDAAGRDRFDEVARRWRVLATEALSDDRSGPRGSGPVAVGGFAFSPEPASALHWASFPPASLVVPQIALARRADRVTVTFAALCRPDDDPAALQEELESRARDLRQSPLPLLDPDPVARMRVASAMPPEHYEGAVARGVERIRAGAFDKIVLAREVQVHAPRPHDAAAVLSVLREAFRECNVFAVGRGGGHVHRGLTGAAGPARGRARRGAGARRLHAAQRGPLRRRAPGRAAAALGQGS